MQLLFKANGILERGRGLTFDDVLLVPCHGEIDSRRNPDLKTPLTRRYNLEIPFISANMDTITESGMATAMGELGGLGIIHRFLTIQDQVTEVKNTIAGLKALGKKALVAASIGVKDNGLPRADVLVDAGVQIITVDVAHGDSIMMLETLQAVKKKYPHVDVIAGNVATAEGVRNLVNAGADAIKVGIGPGSMCTTRIITGCGMPQLTAIALCVQEAKKHQVPVIADGGIKNSGDVIKALAAGAQSVMLGSLLSGTLETPGEIRGGKKTYRGMASKSAQVSWRGELPEGMAAEGESTMVPCKGSVKSVINELCGGIRSGMSYLNAPSIQNIHQNAQFVEMTSAGYYESRPHGLGL